MECKLGILFYLEYLMKEKDMVYIFVVVWYGFLRIFICLLFVNCLKEEIVVEFKEIINYVKDNNMEVILDVVLVVFD